MLQLRVYATPDGADALSARLAALPGVRHVIIGGHTVGGLAQEPQALAFYLEDWSERGHGHGIRPKPGKILAFGPFGALYRVELRQKQEI